MTGPDPNGDPAQPLRSKGLYLLLAVAVLVLDQWTKWLVESHLPHLASRVVVPGFLDLTHVRNTGVAFGLFAAHGDGVRTVVLSSVGLLALGVVLVYFWRTAAGDRLLLAALSLVLGGAVGNLLDRVRSGGVTDFIDVYVGTYHWHTFNVADSAITIGLTLMAWDALRPRRREAVASRADIG
jgi:signal peptidase II